MTTANVNFIIDVCTHFCLYYASSLYVIISITTSSYRPGLVTNPPINDIGTVNKWKLPSNRFVVAAAILFPIPLTASRDQNVVA